MRRGNFFGAKGDILFNLYGAHPVAPAFGLEGKNGVRSATVNPDVEFIDLHLTEACDGCTKVVLEGEGGDAAKDVDEMVVSETGEEGLFVG